MFALGAVLGACPLPLVILISAIILDFPELYNLYLFFFPPTFNLFFFNGQSWLFLSLLVLPKQLQRFLYL